MEHIIVLSDEDVIEIISDDDGPVQTSTQAPPPVRQQPKTKPVVQEIEDIEETSYNAILLDSSPIASMSLPQQASKPVKKPRSDALNKLLTFESDSDDDISEPRLVSKSPKKYVPPISTTELKDMLKKFDSSHDSIVETPKKSRSDVQPHRSPLRQTLEIDDDDEDEDIQIAEHNIILSSSPVRDFADLEDISSSIGEVRPSTSSKTKPLISKDKLRDVDEPIYRFNKALETSEVSNPFLDKLMTQSEKERLRHEQALKKRRSLSPLISRKAATPDKAKRPQLVLSDDSDDDLHIVPSRTTSAPSRQPPPPAASRSTARVNTDQMTTKEARAHAKALKDKQRQELRMFKEANKVNRTKESLLGEMILDVPELLKKQMEAKGVLNELDGITIRTSSKSEDYVHWDREVTSEYDVNTDSFLPSDKKVVQEKKCCFIYDAREFVLMMEMETLLTKFLRFKAENKRFDNFIIVVVEYDTLVKKLKAKENREYTEKVRAQMAGAPVDNPNKKKRKRKNAAPESGIGLQELQETMSELQVHGFKFFPVKNLHDAALWLKSFTYAISSARYDKLERNPEFSNIGTIRSGKDTQDIYLQMLLQFKFMTEPRAKRVIAACPTLKSLYQAVQRGRLPIADDGRTLMNKNVEDLVSRLLRTEDEMELLHEGL